MSRIELEVASHRDHISQENHNLQKFLIDMANFQVSIENYRRSVTEFDQKLEELDARKTK